MFVYHVCDKWSNQFISHFIYMLPTLLALNLHLICEYLPRHLAIYFKLIKLCRFNFSALLFYWQSSPQVEPSFSNLCLLLKLMLTHNFEGDPSRRYNFTRWVIDEPLFTMYRKSTYGSEVKCQTFWTFDV